MKRTEETQAQTSIKYRLIAFNSLGELKYPKESC
jgi:hypothetical protein